MARPKNETPAQMEARWQAESDAGTLRRAAEIAADPARTKAAKAKMQEELSALQGAMKQVGVPAEPKPAAAKKTSSIKSAVKSARGMKR